MRAVSANCKVLQPTVKVSIAMATFNGAEYLEAQLQSFVDQIYQPDELIITDDCSADGTEIIAHKFASIAPFKVEVHRNKKTLGYSGNFNAALSKTTGDLVFMSDQDDVWLPEKIAHMAAVAEANSSALVVMNDAALTDNNLNEVGLTKIGQIRSAGLSMESFVMGSCCAARRELLDICLPIPAAFNSHDNWIVGFGDGLKARIIEEKTLQYYRRHGTNESQFIANRTKKVSRFENVLYSIEKSFRTNGVTQAENERDQVLILIQRISDAKDYIDEKYQSALEDFLNRTEARSETVERRLQVRMKSLIPRLWSAISLLLEGRYRSVGGARAMVRDIIG